MSLSELKSEIRAAANPEKASFFPRFFKAGPGDYAEGDKFLGVVVPTQRALAKKYKDLPLKDIEKLITSPWHEERLTGLFILNGAYKKGDNKTKAEICDFYLSHTSFVNNWDLVDSSAEYIVGAHLFDRPEKLKVLTRLAKSDLLWDRRIAMLATFHDIKKGRPEAALAIAELLLNDTHDLIHKAVGWMLREIGEKCGQDLLVDFLSKHYKTMPRTMLRYSIEKFPQGTRKQYLAGEI